MSKRLDYFATATNAMEILLAQEQYLRSQFGTANTVTLKTWILIKVRVSQLNQCAFCIDMHAKEALKLGETAERLYGLSAWRDMPMYTDLEKQALSWADLVSSGQSISDQDYQKTLQHFGERGIVDLTIAINAINSWNRISKVFKTEIGHDKPD